MLAAVLSQLDVRLSWTIGAFGKLLALMFVLALDSSVRKDVTPRQANRAKAI
jgi:hypothetical protein